MLSVSFNAALRAFNAYVKSSKLAFLSSHYYPSLLPKECLIWVDQIRKHNPDSETLERRRGYPRDIEAAQEAYPCTKEYLSRKMKTLPISQGSVSYLQLPSQPTVGDSQMEVLKPTSDLLSTFINWMTDFSPWRHGICRTATYTQRTKSPTANRLNLDSLWSSDLLLQTRQIQESNLPLIEVNILT